MVYWFERAQEARRIREVADMIQPLASRGLYLVPRCQHRVTSKRTGRNRRCTRLTKVKHFTHPLGYQWTCTQHDNGQGLPCFFGVKP